MTKFKTILLGIVGRIKGHMSTITITVAMTFVSAGFAMLVWAVDKANMFYRDLANALVFLGAFSLIVTLILLRGEQKRENKVRDSLLETMKSIDSEIKGLRNDQRGKGK